MDEFVRDEFFMDEIDETDYVPFNLKYFKKTRISSIVLNNTTEKVWAYPYSEEYSSIVAVRTNLTWKELVNNHLYTDFKYKGKTIREVYERFVELYTTNKKLAKKHYPKFREALDEYSQKLYDAAVQHTEQNKDRAADALHLRVMRINDAARRRQIDLDLIDTSTNREYLLEEARDYGVTVPTQTINLSQGVGTFQLTGVKDEPGSDSVFEPHAITTYWPAEANDPYMTKLLKRKDITISSKTDEDVALYCAAWIKQHLGDEFLETVDTVNGKVSRRDIRLGLVDPDALVECRDFLTYESGRSVFAGEQGSVKCKTRWCADED